MYYLKGSRYYLLLILIIGTFVRFFELGNYPVGFHRDEAYLGYNAFSILKTGSDLTGNFLPLHLESFLFSPAGYSYATIPPIYFLGLSEFSVRFASAAFGSISVLLIYFVSLGLFRDNKHKKAIALLSALFFAILPWSIILSRTATENSIATFLILLSVIFFLRWQQTKWYGNLMLLIATLSSTYIVYQAPRAFVPFFTLSFLILGTFNRFTKKWLIFAIYILLIILPIIFIVNSSTLNTRIRTLSLFESQKLKVILTEQISRDGVANLPYIATRLFHNKYILFGNTFLENYFSHFSYNFLFTENYLPERYVVPRHGIMYFIFLPLMIIGAYGLLRKDKRVSFFLLLWLILAPIGSSLTFDDTQNIQRTYFSSPPYIIITAFGLMEIYLWLHKKNILLRKSFIAFFTIALIYSFIMFVIQYFYQAPYSKPWIRHDGYRELISKINLHADKYKKVVVTNRESAPTIFLLFFNDYEPSKAQKAMNESQLKDTDRVSFGKYSITEEECPLRRIINKDGSVSLSGQKNILYINSGNCDIESLSDDVILVETIHRKDNSKAFYLMAVRE